jgi:high-affinity iron transporter
MFQSLVITLREGIEAALVVGIIILYLRRTGRAGLERAVYGGLAAGILASIACAALFVALHVSEEAYEGWLMILGAALVITLVVWMLRAARGLKREIESKVEVIAGRGGSGAAAAGLFALTAILVLREGVETVIFLAAVNLTTEALLSFLGGLIGLGVAVLFGVSFVRGTARVDLARFFKVTAIVLFMLAAQLLIGGLHELGERGSIPIGREEMRLIGPIVKSDAIVIVSLLALPLIALLIPGRADRERVAQAQGLEGPERRLALARLRRDRLWRRSFAAAGIVAVAALTVSFAFTRLPRGIDPPQMLQPDGDNVRVMTAALATDRLHRYGVLVDDTVVRFFVIRVGDRWRAGFDACQVCGPGGYIMTGGRLVCLACAADINPATVGIGGGCNPLPLPHRMEGQDLVIGLADLRAQAGTFRGAGATAPPGS